MSALLRRALSLGVPDHPRMSTDQLDLLVEAVTAFQHTSENSGRPIRQPPRVRTLESRPVLRDCFVQGGQLFGAGPHRIRGQEPDPGHIC